MKIQKELTAIESLVEKMREKLLALELKIEKRENFYNDKSDKWIESEKGEEYNEKTEELQDLYNDIENEIETIESSIEELRNLSE